MGNQQPKKLVRVTKPQIDMASLKAKIHLQLMRDRKNGQIIKAQKQLINKMKAKSRNKGQQILLAERVVNGLKYTQACNQLISYAISIRGQANFISQNMFNQEKIAPWLPQIYSLMYAADALGLSSLKQFKDLMKALNDPQALTQYVNPQILELLKPTPSGEQLNVYMLQFSQRNNISLQQINMAGHKFSKDIKPIIDPSMKQDSFADLQRKLAQQMNNKVKINDSVGKDPYGANNNGNNQPGGGNQNFNYYNLDKNKPVPPPSQFSNPYGIRQTFDPRSIPNNGPKDNAFYDKNIVSNPQSKPKQFTESRVSINNIDDIQYFPQIQPPSAPNKLVQDPEFDKICQILKAAM